MKVQEIMSIQVDFVTTSTTVKEVCRLIFGRSINGIPVCKEKKVVGFITERDILARFYPSMQEYMEDPVHMSNFELMEQNIDQILSLTADNIMNRKPTTVSSDMPLLQAHSLMLGKKVGRLPVVDKKGNLLGIISKGDIFRTIVGDKIPYVSDEEYHDWLSRHYDLVVDWGKRLGNEVPDLINLFQKEGIEDVMDIGCGTGEHDIALAQKGFRMLGLENSLFMHKAGKAKLHTVSKEAAKKVDFQHGGYLNILDNLPKKFGAAIFMGNAFPHLVTNYKKVLRSAANALHPKKSIIVLQIINFQKVFMVKNQFLDLNFSKSTLGTFHERAFLEFYDPPKTSGEDLTLNMVIFDFDGKRWKYRSMNSTPIANINQKNIFQLLKRGGFKKISFYGSVFLGPLFKDSFQPLESDWLNVVAKR